MKKLLLLGGSEQQVAAIKAAREMGYYTILCDYLSDNPGQYVADTFYQVSTTDKEAVLQIAKEEKIQGIVAYSSDPAAPTAAYISEKMGLPGIPYNIAKTFCEKHLFRKFLKENGFSVPWSCEIEKKSDFEINENIKYPVIIKPTDSSGSKGVTVVREPAQFEKAKELAFEYSRNEVIIAEQFIERDHKDVIEAEIFVVNGEVAVWGLINSIRDKYTNPLLPAAYSYPLNISEDRVEIVKKEIIRLIKCSRIQYGAFNMEMIITKDNSLYFLDVGPRNGGNMLPEFIGGIKQQDLVSATVCAAMGDYEKLNNLKLDGLEGGYWGLSVLHSKVAGIFEEVCYSEEAEKCLLREHFFVQSGDKIGNFQISRDAVGLAFFHFPNRELCEQIMNDFEEKHIKIILKENFDN